jgi:hypothetical protein
MSGSLLVSDGTAGIFPVSFGLYPQEGSRAISVEYDWTSTAAYAEDMSQAEAYGLATTIQAAFIDNSGNAQPVTLIAGGTGQSVTIPGLSGDCSAAADRGHRLHNQRGRADGTGDSRAAVERACRDQCLVQPGDH